MATCGPLQGLFSARTSLGKSPFTPQGYLWFAVPTVQGEGQLLCSARSLPCALQVVLGGSYVHRFPTTLHTQFVFIFAHGLSAEWFLEAILTFPC